MGKVFFLRAVLSSAHRTSQITDLQPVRRYLLTRSLELIPAKAKMYILRQMLGSWNGGHKIDALACLALHVIH